MESNTINSNEVNMLETAELLPWLKEHVLNDSCDVIFIATDRLLQLAEEDEKLMDSLHKADAVFPGANLKICDNEENELQEDVEDTCNINEKFLAEIANDSEIDKLTVMVMSNDISLASLCEERIKNSFDNFEYTGHYIFEEEIDDDAVINDINANLPDILLCSFDSPLQEEWIIENKSKMNVKLCVALSGDTSELLFKKESSIKWITRLFSKQGVFGLNIL